MVDESAMGTVTADVDVTAFAPDGNTRPEPRKINRPLAAGEVLGRYVIVGKLGAGGMGEVYAAFDPELERKVAIKLLRVRSASGRARLLREAQAMAKIVHPNVIAVYDVGTHHDRIYVAMAFIDGMTLRDWCTSGSTPRRTWREVLDVFIDAGRGLAAAHAEDIVHRDFKPENVMIDRKGRVVVLDLGLARGRRFESTDRDASDDAPQGLLSTELSQDGPVSGTPAYMSPEQFAGEDVSERSDQFSFCVALHEALYGERPFPGDSPAAIAFAIHEGNIRPPRHRAVPSWVRRAVLRGLRKAPDERWPSMLALADALDWRKRRRWRTTVAGITVATLLTGTAIAAGEFRAQASPCSGAESHLAGIWDADRRAMLAEPLRASQPAWVYDAWERAADGLDRYASRWAGTYRDVCEATNVRKETSPAVLDVQMACLERASIELEATATELGSLTAKSALAIGPILDGLPDLERCRGVQLALERDATPADARTRDTVAALRHELAGARASTRAGSPSAERIEALRKAVDGTGHAPLVLEHRLALGDALSNEGVDDRARAELDEALTLAVEGRRSTVAIDVLHELVGVVGNELQLPAEGLIYGRLAIAMGAQESTPPSAARLARYTYAQALYFNAQYIEASKAYETLIDEVPEDDRARTRMLRSYAMVLEQQDQRDRALEVYLRVEAAMIADLGEDHPALSTIESDIGNALMAQDDFEGAEARQRRAIELKQRAFGPDHVANAPGHMNLGTILAVKRDWAGADEQFRKTLELIGEDHPRAPMIHQNLGSNAKYRGDHEVAEAEYRLALAGFAKTVGEDHPSTGSLHSVLGEVLDARGKYEEGLAEHRKALELALSAHGEGHERTATYRRRMARNLVETEHFAEAAEILESAMAIYAATSGNEHNLAETKFLLARALWADAGARARARALAQEASSYYRSEKSKQAGEVSAWLAEHTE